MANGSFYLSRTSGSTYLTFRVDWSSSSKGSAANSSIVSVWVYVLKSSSSNAPTNGSVNTTVDINGWSQSENGFQFNVSPGGSTLIFAKSYDAIAHNLDGSKVININVSVGGNIMSANGSCSVALDNIPRESSITATNATIGSTSTITINRASADLTHALRWGFGNLSGTISLENIATPSTNVVTGEWTLPAELYTQIPDARIGEGYIACDTYSGSTLIGTKSCLFYAYVDENASTPTLNPTVVDHGSVSTTLTGDPNKIIRYFNGVYVTFNAAARNSASITSMKVTCGNKSRTSDGLLEYVDSGTFVFSVTDSRGYVKEHIITKTVADNTLIDYIPLTCYLHTDPELVGEDSAEINVTIDGNYFDGSFGAVDNSLAVEYRCKMNNEKYPTDDDGNEIWTPITAAPADGKYSAKTTITGLAYTDTLTVQARAKDKVVEGDGTSTFIITKEQIVRITPVFDWGENDFNFNVPVHFSGKMSCDVGALIVDTQTGADDYTSWYFEEYSNGIGKYYASVKTLYSNGNSFILGGAFSYPVAFDSIISANGTLNDAHSNAAWGLGANVKIVYGVTNGIAWVHNPNGGYGEGSCCMVSVEIIGKLR